ncbi:MAG: hypothetical protein IKJ01_02370, partial [Lachnospiraceae bacterium]|nr:hypothetical protein [Lachnospiraceae bacterium]
CCSYITMSRYSFENKIIAIEQSQDVTFEEHGTELNPLQYQGISYHVVKGIQELQQVYHANLNAGKLYASWKMFAVFTGAAYVLIFIPLVNLACMLLGIIASVIFLISIYQSMELYNIIPKNQDTYNQNTYNNDVYPPKMF